MTVVVVVVEVEEELRQRLPGRRRIHQIVDRVADMSASSPRQACGAPEGTAPSACSSSCAPIVQFGTPGQPCSQTTANDRPGVEGAGAAGAADLRLDRGPVVVDEVVLVEVARRSELVDDALECAARARRRVRRGRSREANERDVEAGRCAEGGLIEARDPRCILSLPPRGDRRNIVRQRWGVRRERVGPVGGDRDDRVDLLRGDDVGPVGRRLTGPAPPGGKGGWREPQRGCKNAECDELTHALRA